MILHGSSRQLMGPIVELDTSTHKNTRQPELKSLTKEGLETVNVGPLLDSA